MKSFRNLTKFINCYDDLIKVANQCGGHGVRIDQCSQAILCTNKSITMQVDGGSFINVY